MGPCVQGCVSRRGEKSGGGGYTKGEEYNTKGQGLYKRGGFMKKSVVYKGEWL